MYPSSHHNDLTLPEVVSLTLPEVVSFNAAESLLIQSNNILLVI